jgi:hypothetical protein
MPDWKRLIVGDAFQLSSQDFNYYRDLFLVWPFLLFTIAGLVGVFGSRHDHRVAVKLLVLALVTILLARERVILILGGLGFCAAQSLLTSFLTRNWLGLAVGIPAGILFFLLIYLLKDYKLSYKWPEGMRIADLLVGLLSLGLSILVLRWIGR